MFGRKRGARCAARLDHFDTLVVHYQLQILNVLVVEHRAERGTKATVHNLTTGAVGDSWIWHLHVDPGDLLAVAPASAGWGEHRDHTILYVGQEGIPGVIDCIDANTLHQALQHRQRNNP